MTVTLLIVDDHDFVREALKLALAGTEIVVAGEAADGRRAWDELQRCVNVQVALVDLQMPEMNGLEFLESIQTTRLPLAVVIHSSWGTPELLAESFRLGAVGFLEKGCDVEEIVSTILAAAAKVGSSGNVTKMSAGGSTLNLSGLVRCLA